MKIFFTALAVYHCSFLTAQVADPKLPQTDTLIETEECTVGFFNRSEKIASPAKTKLVTKSGKTVTLAVFLNSNEAGGFTAHGLSDLDNDGKKELVISGFTGGAHCCDVIHVFKNTGPNIYQQVVKFFGGDVCIRQDNLFTYRFYQQFGYFFTCFACALEDTADTAPVPMEEIALRYNKGKFTVIPGDKELRSTINDNLAKLGELPYEELADNISQDNGLRKAFALNLAVFYYSFGRNLPETQKLFNRYYKYPDAKKIWTEFVKQIQSIRKQSDF